jgi:hypothetical protein
MVTPDSVVPPAIIALPKVTEQLASVPVKPRKRQFKQLDFGDPLPPVYREDAVASVPAFQLIFFPNSSRTIQGQPDNEVPLSFKKSF